MCSLSKHCEVAEIVVVLVAFGNGGGRGGGRGDSNVVMEVVER